MTDATLSVRPAVQGDASLLLTLIRELADYERLSHEVRATEELLHEALFGERPYAEAVIGHVGEHVAGFALFFHNFSTFLARPGMYLEDLYVRPQYRGSGLGKALLQHVAQLAVERGCGRMEWSVLDWNTPAAGFYRNLGAEPMDEWTVFRLTGEALRQVGRKATD